MVCLRSGGVGETSAHPTSHGLAGRIADSDRQRRRPFCAVAGTVYEAAIKWFLQQMQPGPTLRQRRTRHNEGPREDVTPGRQGRLIIALGIMLRSYLRTTTLALFGIVLFIAFLPSGRDFNTAPARFSAPS
jgi:hypothetical protein